MEKTVVRRGKKKKWRLKPGFKAAFIAIPILFAAFAAVLLCNRFWVEQVQVAHVPKPRLPVSSAVPSSSIPIKPVSDNWNYIDNRMSIHITKSTVVFGGRVSIMFAADIRLSDMGYFQTAFAKDEFGRNIVDSVEATAKNNGALLAINGDYYGYRDDGIIVRNGNLYRNQPVRDLLAVFQNGSMYTCSEKSVNIRSLMAKGLIDTFSFGPALVVNGAPASETRGRFICLTLLRGSAIIFAR